MKIAADHSTHAFTNSRGVLMAVRRSAWNTSHILCCSAGTENCTGPICPAGAPLLTGRRSEMAACPLARQLRRHHQTRRAVVTFVRRAAEASEHASFRRLLARSGKHHVLPHSVDRIQLDDGTLVAFAEARRGSCSDGKTREIATRVSHDGGTTWGEVGFAVGNHRSGEAAYYVGPAAVVLADGHTIVLVVARHTPKCEGNCVVGNALVISTDGAVSWSAPLDITSRLGAEGKARTGPGLALRLKGGVFDGRLLVPGSTGTYGGDHVYVGEPPEYNSSVAWRVAADDTSLLAPDHHLDEAQITQLPNGSALIMMRHVSEPWKGKAAAISNDGGDTWGPVRYLPQLKGAVCQSSITTFDGATFYSGPDSTSHQRVRMAVKRSDDSMATFPRMLLIDAGDAAYSCLVPSALLLPRATLVEAADADERAAAKAVRPRRRAACCMRREGARCASCASTSICR